MLTGKPFALIFASAASAVAADSSPRDALVPFDVGQRVAAHVPAVSVQAAPVVRMTFPGRAEVTPRRFGFPLPTKIRPVVASLSFASPLGLIDLYGSVDNLEIACAPDDVELMTLSEPRENGGLQSCTEIRHFQLEAAERAVLRAILTFDATFNWEAGVAYGGKFAYRVKFWRGEEALAVDLCLDVPKLRVVKEGHEIAAGNFEFGAEVLRRVIARCELRAHPRDE